MNNKLLLILFPQVSNASGTEEEYILLSYILSIPSLIVISLLFSYIINQSKKKEFKIIKVGVICILILFPCGVFLTSNGALYPNLIAIMGGILTLPIAYSIIISSIFLLIYKIKWNENNKPIEHNDEDNK